MYNKMYNYSVFITNTDSKYLHRELKKILIKSGFKVLANIKHDFKPFGYTALFLLSESHLAIHTTPEHNKSYIEISSCVKKPFKRFKKEMKKKFIIIK